MYLVSRQTGYQSVTKYAPCNYFMKELYKLCSLCFGVNWGTYYFRNIQSFGTPIDHLCISDHALGYTQGK